MSRQTYRSHVPLDTTSERIARLSEEYLTAPYDRQSEIGSEIADLLVLRIIPRTEHC